MWSGYTPLEVEFQSTLLMRGATVSLLSIDLLDFIIHFSYIFREPLASFRKHFF